MKRHIVLALVCAACIGWLGRAQPAAAQFDPTAFVDPLIGTTGNVNAFPGATLPFGMVQWSPDTTSRPPGGGYDYKDSAITGFSLTHLSGPGCAAMGDFPVLPIEGDVADPAHATQPFSHDVERASPGYYAVSVGAPSASKITVEMSVTARTGIARFTFPGASQRASVLINVSGSEAGDSDAHFSVDAPDAVSGWARTGHFCGSPNEYKVYFAAQFDRAMASYATWSGADVRPHSAQADGTGVGGIVTFDADSQPRVLMKVGVSFVSIAGARANLRAEQAGWDFDGVRRHAATAWQTALARVKAEGAPDAQERIFYTALYHSLLHPNVFSDAGGEYVGFDGVVHHVKAQHAEYANFSGWDIYRTQLPLIAMLFPRETSDMMQSLVDDAHDGGWLPKWPLANTYTDAMNGDSADPAIASAYAFGARAFDVDGALQAMVKGASASDGGTGQGWYIGRPDLDQYLLFGYVTNPHAISVSPPNAASETLEYAVDDFAVSRMARFLGRSSLERLFAARARNWINLFDSSTGMIAPRDADGAFVDTPLRASGQIGFQEGNAAQYTWLVPQDTRALFDAMGGDERVVERLDEFFTTLDGGAGKPYAWLGNEPSILQPWLYLSARAPWKTQGLVRRIQTTMYADTPAGEAGNDDLGTISAWFVWSSIGFYPQTPGVPILDIGSPLFPHVSINSEDGRAIDIDAPRASLDTPYVQSLRVNGNESSRTWFVLPQTGTTRFAFDLGATPNAQWGAAAGDGPPSWGTSTAVRPPPSTTARLTVAPASVAVDAGESAKLSVSLENPSGQAVTASWHIEMPPGLSSTASGGSLMALPGTTASASLTVTTAPESVDGGFYNLALTGRTTTGAALHRAIATLEVRKPGSTLDLAYVLNFDDASVTPIDLRSRTSGPSIAVGANPGDGAVSPDRSTLYVANQGSNTVSVIDARSLQLIATIPVGKVPAGIAFAPDGKTIWISDYGDGDVRSIDAATNVVGAPIAVGTHPEKIAFSPDGMLYVVTQGADALTPVDVKARAALQPIHVGRLPLGIAVSADGHAAYVTNMGSNDVTPVDLVARVAGPPITVGMAPQQPAFTPDGKTLLVPNSGSSTVTPVDVATRKAGKPIFVGSGPFYVMITADGRTAYVVTSGNSSCVPIDLQTMTPGTAIPTGNFPIAIVR